MSSQDFTSSWVKALVDITSNGKAVAPRGMETKEIQQRTIEVDMRYPVLLLPERHLSYQFMAAEAYWILSGDYRVETIEPFNKNIAQFSDDGVTFFGAYGPKIMHQLGYVVTKLLQDPDTRQAGLTIWRENPPPSKDVPCTVAVFFNIRDSKLNCSVYMRSSDVWLGVPYDVFNFSMLTHAVCALVNGRGTSHILFSPGTLYLTAASSHLYTRDLERARSCIASHTDGIYHMVKTPDQLHTSHGELLNTLKLLRYTKPGDPLRWWESHAETNGGDQDETEH